MLRWLLLLASCPALSWSEANASEKERRILLELGQSGLLSEGNASARWGDAPANSTSYVRRGYRAIEIETCASCLITIRFRYLDIRDNCGKKPNATNAPEGAANCRCSYIRIADSSYEDVSSTPFCGLWNTDSPFGKREPFYRSRTRAVTITFFYVEVTTYEFLLEYSSERNRNFFHGYPPDADRTDFGRFLSSPFFPALYPRDLVSEYVISCLRSPLDWRNENCRIRLVFTDFQLATASVMEFFDGNRQRIEVTSGSSFRPPIILTNSSRLNVRFTANGDRSLGFKAVFSFIQGSNRDPRLEPNSDCGGLVEDLGGVITMANMVETGVKSFDCIWLVRPPENFFTVNGNLYLKVDSFGAFAGYGQLEIREGGISEGPLLEKILLHAADGGFREHVASPKTGFYINLKATFAPTSVLGISFTSFHYDKCFAGPEFPCRNRRCIPRQVFCDGFDHCGDGSDEPDLCRMESGEARPADRKWSGLRPNYYFPKTEKYSALKTATLVFVVSSLGLILFLAVLIVLLCRLGNRSRRETDFQSRLQSMTEYLDDAEIEEIIDDDPPVYEAPPEYEAAVKEALAASEARRPKKPAKTGGPVPEAIGASRGGRAIAVAPEAADDRPPETGAEVRFRGQEEVKERRPASPPPPYVEDADVAADCAAPLGAPIVPEPVSVPPSVGTAAGDGSFRHSSGNDAAKSS